MNTFSNNEGDLIVGAAVGAVMGVVWFFRGFKELKIKRTIQNIPASKINTGSVGTDVEIKGNIAAENDTRIIAPISGQQCAIYHIEIQVERRRKNHTYWATIDQYYSHEGFYVDDQSGATAFILPDGARINRDGKTDNYYFSPNDLDEISAPLQKSLTANKRKLKKFKYFLKAKKQIQENEMLTARYDTNQDGILDHNELERGAAVLAQRLSDKHSQKKMVELIPKTKLIFKKKEASPIYHQKSS